MSIGSKIKALRESRGWSQGDLAAKLSVRQSTISRWEAGMSEPMGLYATMVNKLLAQKSRGKGGR